MVKLDNLIGKKYGRLTVVEYNGLVPVGKTNKASTWLCKCECGNSKIVLNNNLKRGITTSCGCFHKSRIKTIKMDLTNQQFDRLLVLKFLRTVNGDTIWLCQCKCGKACEASTNNLNTGNKKSCGCRQGWWRSKKPGLWKNSAAYSKWRRTNPLIKIRHAVSGSIRGMLKHNGSYKRKQSIRNYLPYTIDELKEHLEKQFEPWMNWKNYGGKSNIKKKTWHIDHIIPHSLFNYTSMNDPLFLKCWALSNLRPLEKKKNMRKGRKLTLALRDSGLLA